jgi:hypothetical protein
MSRTGEAPAIERRVSAARWGATSPPPMHARYPEMLSSMTIRAFPSSTSRRTIRLNSSDE